MNINIDKSNIIVQEMLKDRGFDILYSSNSKDNIYQYKNNTNDITTFQYIEKITPKSIKKFYDEYNNTNNFLILISIEKLNSTHFNYQNDNIQIFHINNLLYNPSKNKYVPQHIILNIAQKNKLLELYPIHNIASIYHDDIMCRYLFAKKNDIIKIIRQSNNSKDEIYYRKVINKLN